VTWIHSDIGTVANLQSQLLATLMLIIIVLINIMQVRTSAFGCILKPLSPSLRLICEISAYMYIVWLTPPKVKTLVQNYPCKHHTCDSLRLIGVVHHPHDVHNYRSHEYQIFHLAPSNLKLQSGSAPRTPLCNILHTVSTDRNRSLLEATQIT
jgi:hypothetical protein